MKLFVAVFALAAMAVAEPEADPAVFYSGLGYNYASPLAHTGYAGHGYSGLGYSGLGYSGLGYSGLGYSGLAGVAASPYAYNNFYGAYAGLHQVGRQGYYANSGGAVHIAKRDAEADPAVFYSGLGYNYASPLAHTGYAGLGYSGLGYSGLGYAGLGYSGLGYAGHASPYAYNNFYGAYAGLHAGRQGYYANSGGAVHIAKRDAEADPAAFYGHLGYNYASPYSFGNTYANTYAHTYAQRAYSPYTYGNAFYGQRRFPYAGYGYFK